MEPRQWGWWTRHKLQILSDYLQVFARASAGKATERLYLDLFAGRPENTSRETNEEILGSVRRALEVQPPFTQVHLFELPQNAQALDATLRQRYPDRNVRIHAGDATRPSSRRSANLRLSGGRPRSRSLTSRPLRCTGRHSSGSRRFVAARPRPRCGSYSALASCRED